MSLWDPAPILQEAKCWVENLAILVAPWNPWKHGMVWGFSQYQCKLCLDIFCRLKLWMWKPWCSSRSKVSCSFGVPGCRGHCLNSAAKDSCDMLRCHKGQSNSPVSSGPAQRCLAWMSWWFGISWFIWEQHVNPSQNCFPQICASRQNPLARLGIEMWLIDGVWLCPQKQKLGLTENDWLPKLYWVWKRTHPPNVTHSHCVVPNMWSYPLHPPWFLRGVSNLLEGFSTCPGWSINVQPPPYPPTACAISTVCRSQSGTFAARTCRAEPLPDGCAEDAGLQTFDISHRPHDFWVQ